MPSAIKKYGIAAVAGGGVGIILFVFLTLFLTVLPESLATAFIARPFLAVCYPLIDLGASFFGQAPIPVLIFLGLCWACVGSFAGLLVVAVVSEIQKHRS